MGAILPEQATIIAVLFEGRRDYHVEQQSNGDYLKVVGLTLEDIRQHLAGAKTIGVYPLKDGKVTVAVLDCDTKTPQARESVLYCKRWLEKWGIRSFIEPSGNKGSHLWIFFKDWVSAQKVILVLSYLLHKMSEDLSSTVPFEIFPKQAGGVEFGNAIKLPFGIHRKTGLRTFFLDENLNPCADWGLSAIKAAKPIPEKVLDEIIREEIPDSFSQNKAVVPAQLKKPLPCTAKIDRATVPEGERDITAFRYINGLYRQGYSPDESEAIAVLWDQQHCSPPLGAKIIKAKVKQAYKGKYGLGCLEPIIRQYCDPDCPIYKKRHLQVDGLKPTVEQLNTEIVNAIETLTRPPYWDFVMLYKPEGKTSEKITLTPLTTKQLESPRYLDTLVFEVCGIHPFQGIGGVDWIRYLDTLIGRGKLIKEDAPLDASKFARNINRIYAWCESTPKAEEMEDFLLNRPYENKGKMWFRIEVVEEMFQRKYKQTLERNNLFSLIRGAEGGGGQIRIGNENQRGWWLPVRSTPLPETDEQERLLKVTPAEASTVETVEDESPDDTGVTDDGTIEF